MLQSDLVSHPSPRPPGRMQDGSQVSLRCPHANHVNRCSRSIRLLAGRCHFRDNAVTYFSERTEGIRTNMRTIISSRLYGIHKVDPPCNGEEGCRRRSNRAPDYMDLGANLKTEHSGILLSNGI